MDKFSKRLKDLIKARDMKKMDVAQNVGISPGELTKYLSGERKPGMEVMSNLATLFDVTTDYLTGKSEDNNKSPLEDCMEAFTRNRTALTKDDKIKLVSILMRHIEKDETN